MGPEEGSNETNPDKIRSAKSEKIKCIFLINILTHAQTFAQNLILSRYVYVKVGLGGLLKKLIFRVIL